MKYFVAFGALSYGFTEGFTREVILILAWFVYSLPFFYFRLRFRQMVYGVKGIKVWYEPKFTKEIRALLGIDKYENKKVQTGYQLYTLGFLIIYIAVRIWT